VHCEFFANFNVCLIILSICQSFKNPSEVGCGFSFLFGIADMRLVLGVIVSLLFADLAVAADRPNILWVVSEDNSPEYLGAYGNTLARTPNIDRLAEKGIVFDHVYTAPICAPSRSTIITGVYASSLGTQHMRSERPLPPDVRFFPAALREAGYYCTNNDKTDYNTSTSWKDVWDESSKTAHWRNRSSDQPFFSVFNIFESHESRIFQHLPLQTEPEFVRVPAYLPDTAVVRDDIARYQDCVNRADAAIGKVLAELEADGLADDTIIFYYSDHGGAVVGSKRFLNDAGTHAAMVAYFPPKYSHLAPFDPGTHDPELIHFADLAPTVFSLVGVAPLPQFQGRAFAGPARAPAPKFTYMFADRMDERYNLVRAVTDGRYRYVRNYHPDRHWGQWSDFLWRMASAQEWDLYHRRHLTTAEQSRFFSPASAEAIYDCEADPDNVHNLASDPSMHEQVARMRGALRGHLLSIRDTGFLPEPMMIAQANGHSPRTTTAADEVYPLSTIIDWLDAVQLGTNAPRPIDPVNAPAVMRYWLAAASPTASPTDQLLSLLHDEASSVRIAAAEALLRRGESADALAAIEASLAPEVQPEVQVFALDALARIQPALTDSLGQRLGDFAASPAWGGSDYFLARLSRHLLADHRKPAFILNVESSPSSFDLPYPSSQTIAGLTFDWTTHNRHALGSDNFQLTWAADDNLYGAWGDGGGFGGTNNLGRANLGFARIEGPAADYQGFNVWGGFESEHPATFNGKSWGTIALDDTLFMWTVPDVPPNLPYRNHFEHAELARSLDHGATWTKAEWKFNEVENLSVPTFLNFGRGNAGVPQRMDGYIYSYFIRPEKPDLEQMGPKGRGLRTQVPGDIYLARAAPDELFESRESQEFFTGVDDGGKPTWGGVADKQPVFSDASGVGWCVSAAYHPGLDRILLTTEHGISHHGQLGIFESPNPWGPWATVTYFQPTAPFGSERLGSDLPWRNNVFFASFPTKWFDGDTFTLSFTGSGSGSDNDSFNTVRGTFRRR
tara:strand:+ start:720071 stop:723112 length:3042 start_codon:yes stop_codon:yes gene_type:complete